jgi:AcrR family transcriptional regulator
VTSVDRSPGAAGRRNATYYPGDLRRALLDAALEVIVTQGPAAVSLRALARQIGVSHAAPGNHFADKAALFTAIGVEGYETLVACTAQAVLALPPGADAVERLRAAGLAYVTFAHDHRGHFEVMWRNDLLHTDDPALVAAGGAAFAGLVAAVREAQAEGWAADADPLDVVELAWATVHGLSALWLNGPLRDEDQRPLDVIADAVTRLMLDAFPRTPATGPDTRVPPEAGRA